MHWFRCINLFYRSRLIRMEALTRAFTHSQELGDRIPYTLSDKRDGYEVRSYNESKWIATTVTGTSWKDATDVGVSNLLEYVRSEKKQTAASAAIIPVVTKIVPGEGPVCHSTFDVLLHILSDPPALSSDASVRLVVMPPMVAYVAEHSGPISDQIMIDEAEKLAVALRRDGVSVSDANYYTTTYGNTSQRGHISMDVWFMTVIS